MRNSTVQVIKKTGQRVFRDSEGHFMSMKKVNRKNSSIRSGSLYDYRGTTVRAREAYNRGRRLVSIHNELHGVVQEGDLTPINKRKVNRYLKNSPNV
jgi:hypothetical protein